MFKLFLHCKSEAIQEGKVAWWYRVSGMWKWGLEWAYCHLKLQPPRVTTAYGHDFRSHCFWQQLCYSFSHKKGLYTFDVKGQSEKGSWSETFVYFPTLMTCWVSPAVYYFVQVSRIYSFLCVTCTINYVLDLNAFYRFILQCFYSCLLWTI